MKKSKKYYIFRMNTNILNTISLLLLAIILLITYFIYGREIFSWFNIYLSLSILFMIPYFMFHEVLHSISYCIHGAEFKNITYGMHIEKGVLCCLCKQNISKKNILISLLYPFIFIGIITYIIGIVIHSPILILLSIYNISGCSGDLIMFYALSKLKNYEYSEFDDPTSFGLYSDTDLSNKKMFGLDFIEVKDDLEIKDLKKVSISKTSLFITIGFILFALLEILLFKYIG